MTFEQSIGVDAAVDHLFALTQDYGRRLQWDPFLKSAALLNGADVPRVGVRAYCVARSGLGMETEYVSYAPPRVAAVKMTRGPCFLRRFAGTWRFEGISPYQSRVIFRYHLETRPRWLAGLLTPVFAWAFGRDTHRRLLALKTAAETPEPTSG